MSQQLVKAKATEVFAKAKELYPHLSLMLDKVGIRFDLKGRAAGIACARNGRDGRSYYMRFNTDMLAREAADHVINETVPHEIAHIICFMDPSLGRGHDRGWANVFRRLGGSGDRTHKEEIVFGKGRTYEYTTTTGQKIRMSEKRHAQPQRGTTMRWKHGKGDTNQFCAYEIVGYQGNTLKAPIAGKVAPRPNSTYNIDVLPTETLLTGKYVGADQYPAAFGKSFVTTIATPVEQARKPQQAVRTPVAAPANNGSKAAISRGIMLAGYRAGKSYEMIIVEMIAACGYNRQLARGTYKANCGKIGIPEQY